MLNQTMSHSRPRHHSATEHHPQAFHRRKPWCRAYWGTPMLPISFNTSTVFDCCPWRCLTGHTHIFTGVNTVMCARNRGDFFHHRYGAFACLSPAYDFLQFVDTSFHPEIKHPATLSRQKCSFCTIISRLKRKKPAPKTALFMPPLGVSFLSYGYGAVCLERGLALGAFWWQTHFRMASCMR